MTRKRRPFPGLPLNRFVAARNADGSVALDKTAVPAVEKAEVILGRDINTGHEFIVYGRDVLQRLAAIKAPQRHKIVVIEVNPQKDPTEIPLLVTIVTAVKGRNDYSPQAAP